MKDSYYIGSFQVSQAESDQFAEASGDFNPLHVDPVSARRYQFGTTVIHGVCGFMKAIDLMLAQCRVYRSIVSVRVQFVKPVLHDKKVDVYQSDVTDNRVQLQLLVTGKRVQTIDIEYLNIINVVSIELTEYPIAPNSVHVKPIDLAFSDANSLSQSFNLVWAPKIIELLFQNVKQYLPNYQTAVLLGLTNIVGMQCPGKNSVFAGFYIQFKQQVATCDSMMKFSVSKCDARFSIITIHIDHNTAEGEIEALFRPKPVWQPIFNDIQTIVPKDIFSDQRAVIIGGSRGAGEVTAKLISAGGGHVVITYAQGKDDAQRVAQDIQSNGGKCDIFLYNVLQPEAEITAHFRNKSATHIYYFASPLIEKSDDAIWDDAIFQKFNAFYLTGLTNLIRLYFAIPEYRKQGITIYIPSTIFLEQPQLGFNEYAAAKSAVESFANQFRNRHRKWKFVIPRLPRMLTDQTSGVADDPPLRSAEIILESLLEMYKNPL